MNGKLTWVPDQRTPTRTWMPGDAISRWIAYRLPLRVVYWAMIRGGVIATTGAYSKSIVPDLTLTEALRRLACRGGLT